MHDALYFRLGGPFTPRVVPINLPAPPALRGLRCLFVTDIHMGCTHSPFPRIERLFALLRSLNPDLVLWGGDYAEPGWHDHFFTFLPNLSPPLGMFGVVGNNDLHANFSRAPSLSLLCNQSASLPGLCILGLDDPRIGNPDLSLLLNMPKNAFRIVLAHSPLAFRSLPQDDPAPWPDLILTGHTHGGQCTIFGLNPYAFGYENARHAPNFFLTGLHSIHHSRFLVSNGIGTSLLPVRLGAPPQVHLITFI